MELEQAEHVARRDKAQQIDHSNHGQDGWKRTDLDQNGMEQQERRGEEQEEPEQFGKESVPIEIRFLLIRRLRQNHPPHEVALEFRRLDHLRCGGGRRVSDLMAITKSNFASCIYIRMRMQ